MGKYTKEEAISVVVSCAKKYHNELENRTFLFVCKDKHGNITFHEFKFYDRNFKHLTGLKTDGKRISAKVFYQKCLSHKLSPKDFEFSPDGTTFLKLDVLPSLMTKNISAKMIGDYDSANPKLYTEKLAGNINACIGFQTDEKTKDYVPNTVLNGDIRDYIRNQAQVIATFRTSPKSSIFNEITYVAKNADLSSFRFPSNYKYLPSMINSKIGT